MRPPKLPGRAQSPPEVREENAPPQIVFDELIVEILSWLPVKSLVRFRCVCKSWKSLISDPQFVKLHLHRSATNPDFAQSQVVFERISNDQRCAISCSVRSLLHNLPEQDVCYRLKDKSRVLGSCNGLICLFGILFKRCWVRLLNPATRLKSEKSPPLYVYSRSYHIRSFGFGYDHLSDTYKVVAVLYHRSHKEDSHELKVYSMGDNCWRNILCFPAVPVIVNNDGKFVSGTLNWLAVPSFDYYIWNAVTNDQLVIVSIDLGTETYTQFLLPHVPDEVPHAEPTLTVLEECLCVSYDYKRTHLVIWQMKEFGVHKSWTQLFNVSYQDHQIGCFEFPSLLPLYMSENGDVMMVPHFNRSQAILYNRRDNRLKRCQIPNNIYWINAKLYTESLVSPCSRVA